MRRGLPAPGGSSNDAAEIATGEVRILVRENIGFHVAERRLPLVLCKIDNAALMSQAAIDAIPENADVADEINVIELAIAPVDALAQLILRMPCKSEAGRAVRSRAQAWMDSHYWTAAEIAA